jgi:hypothetical protein
MSFISFSIWQIRLVREKDFMNALVGFQNDAEMGLLSADMRSSSARSDTRLSSPSGSMNDCRQMRLHRS